MALLRASEACDDVGGWQCIIMRDINTAEAEDLGSTTPALPVAGYVWQLLVVMVVRNSSLVSGSANLPCRRS